MGCLPDHTTFCRLAESHDLVPVFCRLAADTLTPVSAFHRLRGNRGAFLLESVVGGEQVGRFSFLTSEPYLTFTAHGHDVTTVRDGQRQTRRSENPLHELRSLVQQQRLAELVGLPPFVGGAVGYLGYDVVRYSERLPHPPLDDRRLPDISMSFYDRMVVMDGVQKTVLVAALAHIPTEKRRLRQVYDAACARVADVVRQLTCESNPLQAIEVSAETGPEVPAPSNFTREGYEQAARRCVDYIRAGDIFQVVLSQRMTMPVSAPPLEIYRTLRTINPSPFMFLLETPEVSLVGSSPEIMCRVVDGHVTVRPLAGTRIRGDSAEEDARLARELLTDPKERAEHVMLVDLGRNDVGRVARFGSVQLSDVMTVERYSHVMHITSNVTGQLRNDCDAFDALMACLPAGTVSGAPKVRAMEIIDELEPHRRGPYAGAIGYFDFRGNMDTCIALRTIVIHGNSADVQAGAGIVADSQPALEYQETLNKAQALLRAIAITENRVRTPNPFV